MNLIQKAHGFSKVDYRNLDEVNYTTFGQFKREIGQFQTTGDQTELERQVLGGPTTDRYSVLLQDLKEWMLGESDKLRTLQK